MKAHPIVKGLAVVGFAFGTPVAAVAAATAIAALCGASLPITLGAGTAMLGFSFGVVLASAVLEEQ